MVAQFPLKHIGYRGALLLTNLIAILLAVVRNILDPAKVVLNGPRYPLWKQIASISVSSALGGKLIPVIGLPSKPFARLPTYRCRVVAQVGVFTRLLKAEVQQQLVSILNALRIHNALALSYREPFKTEVAHLLLRQPVPYRFPVVRWMVDMLLCFSSASNRFWALELAILASTSSVTQRSRGEHIWPLFIPFIKSRLTAVRQKFLTFLVQLPDRPMKVW